MHTLKETVFVLCVFAVGYAVWEVMEIMRPPSTHSAGQANPYVTDNPKYKSMMGIPPEQVQFRMEGKTDAFEADQD